MKKTAPTKEERAIARKVLKFYLPQAIRLSNHTEQEKPALWSAGCEEWIELLKTDPALEMNGYREEYDLGNADFEE